jgi:hypothetical protein
MFCHGCCPLRCDALLGVFSAALLGISADIGQVAQLKQPA